MKESRVEFYCPSCGSHIFIEGEEYGLELSHVSISKKQAKELGIKYEKTRGIIMPDPKNATDKPEVDLSNEIKKGD